MEGEILESVILERAERMARNLPVKSVKLRRTDCRLGHILFAYGKDTDGTYWGCYVIGDPTFIMHPMEFQPGVSEEDVQRSLVGHAEWLLEQFKKRGLLRSGARFGARH